MEQTDWTRPASLYFFLCGCSRIIAAASILVAALFNIVPALVAPIPSIVEGVPGMMSQASTPTANSVIGSADESKAPGGTSAKPGSGVTRNQMTDEDTRGTGVQGMSRIRSSPEVLYAVKASALVCGLLIMLAAVVWLLRVE